MRTRRFPRYKVDLPVRMVKFWEETPVGKAEGRCQVLAEGGLGATVYQELYLGEVVRLEVGRIAKLYAAVRYSRGSEFGFEFIFTDEAQRRAIRQFCQAQATTECSVGGSYFG